MSASASAASNPGESFAPSVRIRELQTAWETLSETQGDICAYLDQSDDEVLKACSIQKRDALQHQLPTIYRKLGFVSQALSPENRYAAYLFSKYADGGKRPAGAEEALIIYATTGRIAGDFSSLVSHSSTPVPATKPAPTETAPPAPGPSQGSSLADTATTEKTEKSSEVPSLEKYLGNLGSVSPASLQLLSRGAKDNLTDDQIVATVQQSNPQFNIEQIQGYFSNAFNNLGISQDLSYDERRAIAVEVLRVHLKIEEPVTTPQSEDAQITVEDTHIATETPEPQAASQPPASAAMAAEIPGPTQTGATMAASPENPVDNMPLPSDDELRKLTPHVAQLKLPQRTLLEILSTKGISYPESETARELNIQEISISPMRSTIANILGIQVSPDLNLKARGRMKTRIAIRVWELSNEKVDTPKPEAVGKAANAPAPPEPKDSDKDPQVLKQGIPPAEPKTHVAKTEDEPVINAAAQTDADTPAPQVPPMNAEEALRQEDLIVEELPTTALAVVHTPAAEVAALPQAAPLIITKANLGLWALVGTDTKILDSDSPTFHDDLQELLGDGYRPVDGDNIISPDSVFRARTLLTFARERKA